MTAPKLRQHTGVNDAAESNRRVAPANSHLGSNPEMRHCSPDRSRVT